jgi:hypothetical protein
VTGAAAEALAGPDGRNEAAERAPRQARSAIDRAKAASIIHHPFERMRKQEAFMAYERTSC